MAKYRTDTRDVAPKIVKPDEKKIGELPPGRLAIYDANGIRVGHVGRSASEATVRRFGVARAKLGKMDGKDAWLGWRGNVTGGYGSAQNKKLAKSLRAAKGSVSK